MFILVGQNYLNSRILAGYLTEDEAKENLSLIWGKNNLYSEITIQKVDGEKVEVIGRKSVYDENKG